MKIYGTIGPACASPDLLRAMFAEGMTGMRINTSHISVKEATPQIQMIQEAATACGIVPDLLIDLQGPELRIGRLQTPLSLAEGQVISFVTEQSADGIPVSDAVFHALTAGQQVLLDDGKLLLEMTAPGKAVVFRGGTLKSGKSIALPGVNLRLPALTRQDLGNIRDAVQLGITGVMQPFVRDADDLRQVREALNEAGGQNIALFAKIEDLNGVEHLASFFALADEIVIARGDLGNAMPLWELPRVQDQISRQCREANVPFMVVTQMLASMEHSAVPTRAEVSDIYRAVKDGAASIMVTGETAAGEYPVEVIRYLSRTAKAT